MNTCPTWGDEDVNQSNIAAVLQAFTPALSCARKLIIPDLLPRFVRDEAAGPVRFLQRL